MVLWKKSLQHFCLTFLTTSAVENRFDLSTHGQDRLNWFTAYYELFTNFDKSICKT